VRTCLLRNAEETEDHGTVYETRTKKMREQIAAMKEIWTKDKPEHHGEFVSFPPMMTGPSRRRSRIRR
jgi:alkanesulfonate monooxygenase SsuD/methylene tetrahydromethanopterin reductase-like flavin-dependent oxidoreductase (luciferase family)